MTKFLIDNALSPSVALRLRKEGYDAVHVREIGLGHASDGTIFHKAFEEDRIIVSADTDFGALLAGRQHSRPSFILFRGDEIHRPSKQLALLLDNVPAILEDLKKAVSLSSRKIDCGSGRFHFHDTNAIETYISALVQ